MDYDKFVREFLKLNPTRLDTDTPVMGGVGLSIYKFIFKQYTILFVERMDGNINPMKIEYFFRVQGCDDNKPISSETFDLVREYYDNENIQNFFNDVNMEVRARKLDELNEIG